MTLTEAMEVQGALEQAGIEVDVVESARPGFSIMNPATGRCWPQVRRTDSTFPASWLRTLGRREYG